MNYKEIAVRKLYEAFHQGDECKPWDLLSTEGKTYYAKLAEVVQDNTPAPIDCDVWVKLPGLWGRNHSPILRRLYSDVTAESIDEACKELADFLKSLLPPSNQQAEELPHQK